MSHFEFSLARFNLGKFVPEMKCLGIALISVYFLPSPVERKINCAELLALCP